MKKYKVTFKVTERRDVFSQIERREIVLTCESSSAEQSIFMAVREAQHITQLDMELVSCEEVKE